METIDELRAKVDQVDGRVLVELNERARLVLEIRQAKKESGMPAHDPAREKEILEKVLGGNKGPLDDSTVQGLFEHIIQHMRAFGYE